MKIVATISPGNSGGGAIHDFIKLNTRYYSPVKGHEFRLLQDPDGLLNLYKNFYEDFTINNCSNALNRFKNYTQSLSKLKMKVGGRYVRIFDKKFIEETNNFTDKITLISYSALPQFYKVQMNFFEKLNLGTKSRFFNAKQNHLNKFNMILPVDEKIFLREAKKYLKKIIQSNLKKKQKIILDQPISIWNYHKIFKFFDDVKLIIVTRDPRSIFYSMKSRSSKAYPGADIKKFVIWYDYIIKKFYLNYKQNLFHKKILKINFENFVSDETLKNKILKFIDDKEINYKFDFSKSKNNAYKAKRLLSNKDQLFIEKKLKSFLQW